MILLTSVLLDFRLILAIVERCHTCREEIVQLPATYCVQQHFAKPLLQNFRATEHAQKYVISIRRNFNQYRKNVNLILKKVCIPANSINNRIHFHN